MNTLDRLIDQAPSLPPAPTLLPELLAALGEDDVDSARVERLITFDPVLTAHVLRRCHSAQFGFAKPVQDLQEAVLRLGFSEIYQIVASVIGEPMLAAQQPGYGIAQGELWKHCAVSAVAARVAARELGGDESMVFTAALLHDIGKLVLSTALEGAYTEVIAKTVDGRLSFFEAEEAILGVEHAAVGGRLLQRWNFPENLVQAVWHHHDPRRAQAAESLAAYVHLGDVLAHMLGHGYGHQAYAVRCRAEALDRLKISPTGLEQLMLTTFARTQELFSPQPAAA
jgi:putative nucleotidyltransferase with HDIG domain